MSSLNERLHHALALHQARDLAGAEAQYRAILAADPRNLQAMHLLGVVHHQRGEHARAVELIAPVAKAAPNVAAVRVNLANALAKAGHLSRAMEEYHAALRLDGQLVQAVDGLAHTLMQAGRLLEAAAAFDRLIQMGEQGATVYNELGLALMLLGRKNDAAKALQEAVKRDPDLAEAHANLSHLYRGMGRTSDAVAAGEAAVRCKADFPAGWNNLANALADQARLRDAESAYRRAADLSPADPRLLSNLLFHLNSCDWLSAEQIAHEHFKFGQRFGRPCRVLATEAPRNRLRIAYLSGDLREHSVAYFIEPLLRTHDKTRFDVFCYSDNRIEDAVTKRLKSAVSTWRTIAGMPDDAVADLIQHDGIDILVDLAGHSADNRLMVFAQKPAPVQATYLGYPNTTGLATIDFRITDAIADPPGAADARHSEKLIRLNRCFLCYGVDPSLPPVGDLPRQGNGYVTFGSFNNLHKITETTLRLWSNVLGAVPGARLLLKYRSLADAGTVAFFSNLLHHSGINPARVELLGHVPSRQQHLSTYNRIDIALDTTPYNGTTTTCEAVSMGVPVVTLAGDAHVSRVGASLLTALEMPELVASNEHDFISIATKLSSDLPRLVQLRQNLRPIMLASPLCDVAAFTREMERVYQAMVQRSAMS
jgi:predicted O-linked N-acetylglucosamine transferase (SPINDLY family)